MTVETTSFLSTAKSNSQEKSAKILKSHKNLIIILLVVVLLIFCLSASLLQLWTFHRMNGMQDEINQLKGLQEEINQLKGKIHNITIFEQEISDFNRVYPNSKYDDKEQIDPDEKNTLVEDKVMFDDDDLEDDDEDDEDYDPEDTLTTEYGSSGNGRDYVEGDKEYDEDVDDDYSSEDEQSDSPKDENNIFKDMELHSRRTRSIAGSTQQGVPIIDEPYVSRRNRTKTSHDANDPKLKLTWNGNARNNLRRDPYRPLHNTRHHHHNHHQHSSSNRFAFAAAPVHHTFQSYGQKFNDTASTDTPSIPMQTRQSRVMHFEDKTKAFRQVVRKDQLAKLQEQRMAPEQYVQNAYAAARRPMRKNLELKNAKRKQFITAVHFDGDYSNLEQTRHYSYKGNGKVELNKNEYLHWKPAPWVYSHGMTKYFHMDSTGTLTVNDHGLFLIYAQVLYSDSHDLNAYVIEHNGLEQYRCTTMTHTGDTPDKMKTNSCYTSGLIHLRNGDKIRLRDIGNHRIIHMDKAKSYFGLIKINLVPAVSASAESTEVERSSVVK